MQRVKTCILSHIHRTENINPICILYILNEYNPKMSELYQMPLKCSLPVIYILSNLILFSHDPFFVSMDNEIIILIV